MEKETVVFDSAVKSLMEGMDAYLSAKTVSVSLYMSVIP